MELSVYRVDFSSGAAVLVVAPNVERAVALVLDEEEYMIVRVKRLKPFLGGVIVDPGPK